MPDADEKSSFGGWGLAIVCSLALHGIVLWLLVSGGESPVAEDVASPASASAGQASGENPASPVDRLSAAPPAESGEILRPVDRIAGAPPPGEPASGQAASAGHMQSVTPATAGDDGVPAEYTVRQGDTITKIAKRYGMTPEEIARLNKKPLSKLNNIWVGQKLKLK